MPWSVLAAQYGDHEVPVVLGVGKDAERTTQKLSDAIHNIQNNPSTPLYIKDWHLVRSARTDSLSRRPNDPLQRCLPYTTPYLFADDWMNNVTPPASDDSIAFTPDAWLRQNRSIPLEQDDFRFCYAGTRGSSTPLHRDGSLPSLLIQFVRDMFIQTRPILGRPTL